MTVDVLCSRVLARTLIVGRTVIDLAKPDLVIVLSDEKQEPGHSKSLPNERQRWMQEFWSDLLTTLRLDDVDQPLAKALAESNIFFPLPAGTNTWLTCYFSARQSSIGVFLGITKTSSIAMEIGSRLEAMRDEIDREIGLTVRWERSPEGKVQPAASKRYDDLRDPGVREDQLAWFRTAINAFVNALRPRILALYRDLATP